EEAAFQQIFAQALRLVLMERPRFRLNGVHEREVEDVVVLEVHDLLIAPGVDARQPPQRREKGDVGFRIVARPRASAVEAEAETANRAADLSVLQTRPGELVLRVSGRLVSTARKWQDAAALSRQHGSTQTHENRRPQRELHHHLDVVEAYQKE